VGRVPDKLAPVSVAPLEPETGAGGGGIGGFLLPHADRYNRANAQDRLSAFEYVFMITLFPRRDICSCPVV
jgi:hypothetical protein